MTKSEITQEFLQGRNCAQCVFSLYAEEVGFDPAESDRIAACFGGGMELGQTCGAVTGALMAIGLMDGGQEMARKFKQEFSTRHGSCMCRELIAYDFSDPEQACAAKESGVLLEKCPEYVESACDILDQLLNG